MNLKSPRQSKWGLWLFLVGFAAWSAYLVIDFNKGAWGSVIVDCFFLLLNGLMLLDHELNQRKPK